MKKTMVLIVFCVLRLNLLAQMTREKCLLCDSIYKEVQKIETTPFIGKTLDDFLKSTPLLKDLHRFFPIDDNFCVIQLSLTVHSPIIIDFFFDNTLFTNRCNKVYWTENEFRKQKIEKIEIRYLAIAYCKAILAKD
jgi:hypothetical protein